MSAPIEFPADRTLTRGWMLAISLSRGSARANKALQPTVLPPLRYGKTAAELRSYATLTMPMEERYWSFPVVKPEAEWNNFDRAVAGPDALSSAAAPAMEFRLPPSL